PLSAPQGRRPHDHPGPPHQHPPAPPPRGSVPQPPPPAAAPEQQAPHPHPRHPPRDHPIPHDQAWPERPAAREETHAEPAEGAPAGTVVRITRQNTPRAPRRSSLRVLVRGGSALRALSRI